MNIEDILFFRFSVSPRKISAGPIVIAMYISEGGYLFTLRKDKNV